MSEKPYLIHFTGIGDEEIGFISVAQVHNHVPFDIKRVYWVYQTPEYIERGNHAHKVCMQVLVAVSGEVEVVLESVDGTTYQYTLTNPAIGLFIPILHWRKIHFSSHAVLVCLASAMFDEQDYIRNYETFISLKH
jgi:hypothetical protein